MPSTCSGRCADLPWHPYELRFAQAVPADPTPFRRYEPPGIVSLLHLLMHKRITEVEAEPADDLAAELRHSLPSMVLGGELTLGAVAARIGLSERSLNRRLAAKGESVRALIEEVRGALARQLLQDTRLAVYDIGERLGYANPSAFTRAFRRWTGKGPAQRRASRRRPSRSPSR